MNKIEMCIEAITIIANDPDGNNKETVQRLKDSFEIIFSDDEYFQKYRPTKYYLQTHLYYQQLFKIIKQEEPFDEKKVLSYENLLPDKWGRRELINFIIEHFYETENAEKMRTYIPKLAETGSEYQGYRMLLKLYAAKGNAKDFLSVLKDCKPKQCPMSEITESKFSNWEADCG